MSAFCSKAPGLLISLGVKAESLRAPTQHSVAWLLLQACLAPLPASFPSFPVRPTWILSPPFSGLFSSVDLSPATTLILVIYFFIVVYIFYLRLNVSSMGKGILSVYSSEREHEFISEKKGGIWSLKMRVEASRVQSAGGRFSVYASGACLVGSGVCGFRAYLGGVSGCTWSAPAVGRAGGLAPWKCSAI